MLLVSFALVVGLVEIVSREMLARGARPAAVDEVTELYPVEEHPDYGWVLRASTTHRAVKALASGEVCYDVVYRTDAFRRRVTHPQLHPQRPHLLLFGGSTTLGEGLPDDQTLQHLLARSIPDHNVYNYAVHGYGPAHVLAQLESGVLPEQVASRRGRALYLMIPEHVSRVTGDTRAFWAYRGPYYTATERGVARQGSFLSARPLTTALYQGFLALKQRSSFLTLINLELPPRIPESALELTTRVLLRARQLYESQFDGSFTVVLHPSWDTTEPRGARTRRWLRQRLEREGVPIFDYARPGSLPPGDVIHPECDLHPNGSLNRWLASAIVEDLRDPAASDGIRSAGLRAKP